MPHMRYVRKAVVAAVGLGLMLLNSRLDVDLMGFHEDAVGAVLAVLTVLGVYAVPNDPKPDDPPESSA